MTLHHASSRIPLRRVGASIASRVPSRWRPSASRSAPDARWLAAIVLGLSGFASLAHEIAWTRILALVLGPTTYAFAATLAAVISGVALGSAGGSWLIGRTRRPEIWLSIVLAMGAVTTSYTYSLAGQRFPALVAALLAGADNPFGQLLRQGLLLTAALESRRRRSASAPPSRWRSPSPASARQASPRALASWTHDNTLGAVSGSLAAGFGVIPRLGLEGTLQVVSGSLVVGSVVVLWRTVSDWTGRAPGMLACLAAVVLVGVSPSWDRELLASGPYMYAPFVPRDLDLNTQLKAGTLLYYRRGCRHRVGEAADRHDDACG